VSGVGRVLPVLHEGCTPITRHGRCSRLEMSEAVLSDLHPAAGDAFGKETVGEPALGGGEAALWVNCLP